MELIFFMKLIGVIEYVPDHFIVVVVLFLIFTLAQSHEEIERKFKDVHRFKNHRQPITKHRQKETFHTSNSFAYKSIKERKKC